MERATMEFPAAEREEVPILVPYFLDENGLMQRIWHSFDRLNASWTRKWWYSTVHNITAVVGAGVLGLPSSLAYLTWFPGITAIILLWILSLVTYWQMTEMHERRDRERGIIKYDRYHELGQYLFGPKLGLWLVIPSQIMIEIGVDIVYILTAARSIQYIVLLNGGGDFMLRYCIIIFASVQLFLCQFKEITSITWISIIAAITAVCYTTITWSVVPFNCPDPTTCSFSPSSAPSPALGQSTGTNIFQSFASVGQIAFALAGHNVVLEIQATMPSTEQKPSKLAMWRGGLVAYIIIASCYLLTATICFWKYGDILKKQDNMLLLLRFPKPLVTMANLMLVFHMIGSYQIYAMPFFNKLEEFIEKSIHVKPRASICILSRLLYVCSTCLVALAVPFFADLQGFIGGFAYLPSTYVLPCLMWHFYRRPKPFSLHWIGNMAIIALGILLSITSTAGGLYIIKKNAKDFHLDWAKENFTSQSDL